MTPMLNHAFSYSDLEFFLLVLTRMSCFIFVAPFFSTNNVPRQVKIVLSLFLSYIVYISFSVHNMPEYSSLIGYAALVLKEAMCGLIIGFGANICLPIVHFAGRVTDMEIGLSMVHTVDPLTRESTGFSGSLYEYAVIFIMMINGMINYFVKAIVETYTLIPIGEVTFRSDAILTTVTTFLGDYVSIAFRMALPVVASIMVLNAVLGILVKASPQINMFSVGMHFKMIVGLSVLFLTVQFLPAFSDYIFKEMKTMMTAMVRSMSLVR